MVKEGREALLKSPQKRDITQMACVRCGYIYHLELHHIKHRVDGGMDERENLRCLCRACHDYQHAKEAVLSAIKAEQIRIAVLKKRLAVIEKENSPEQILKRGYQPYFKIFSEKLPPKTECGRVNF